MDWKALGLPQNPGITLFPVFPYLFRRHFWAIQLSVKKSGSQGSGSLCPEGECSESKRFKENERVKKMKLINKVQQHKSLLYEQQIIDKGFYGLMTFQEYIVAFE